MGRVVPWAGFAFGGSILARSRWEGRFWAVDPIMEADQNGVMEHAFAARLARSPLVFDAAVAAEISAAFPTLPPDVRHLLAASASCAPFLRDLMRREGAWLPLALARAPEAAFAAVLADLEAVKARLDGLLKGR